MSLAALVLSFTDAWWAGAVGAPVPELLLTGAGLLVGLAAAGASESTVYLVDRHPITRRGFRSLISEHTGLRVIGETGEARQAFDDITQSPPDLVVTSLSVDGMGGISFVERLLAYDRDLRILAVSDRQSALYGERTLRAGVKGYIRKSEPVSAFTEAMRTVLNGDFHLPTDVQNLVVRRSTSRSPDSAQGESGIEALSTRELEVFERMGQGRSTAEIAEDLNISTKTVHSHRRSAQKKIGADTLQELTYLAVRWVHDC
jgi:DNA-binding NarL/FixJ family response regulator